MVTMVSDTAMFTLRLGHSDQASFHLGEPFIDVVLVTRFDQRLAVPLTKVKTLTRSCMALSRAECESTDSSSASTRNTKQRLCRRKVGGRAQTCLATNSLSSGHRRRREAYRPPGSPSRRHKSAFRGLSRFPSRNMQSRLIDPWRTLCGAVGILIGLA